jgi:hypothetical protein
MMTLMNLSIELGAFAQLAVTIANIIIAVVMYKSIREVVKDRKLRFLEKRLDEFYIPLIKYFGQGDLHRNIEAHQRVEEILISKRHLCGRKVAENLPQHFTAVITSEGGFYFCFTNENELKRWEEVADIIWEEYVEVLREYYKLIDIKHYALPEKPKWMFMICSHSFLRK